MMYMFHIAFALGLIALVAGCKLVLKAGKCEVSGSCLSKIIGYIVVILAIISLSCSTWCHFKGGSCPVGERGMMSDMMDKPAAGDAAKKKL